MAVQSELLWILGDYEEAGIDAPGRVRANPELCEADLMTQEEIDEFVKDSIATLRILADKDSPRYDDMTLNFVADMAALVKCGRMDEDEYEALTSEENLSF